jgi:hypothetical protein
LNSSAQAWTAWIVQEKERKEKKKKRRGKTAHVNKRLSVEQQVKTGIEKVAYNIWRKVKWRTAGGLFEGSTGEA